MQKKKSIRNQGVIFKNISKTKNQNYVTKEAVNFSMKMETILACLHKPWWLLSTTTTMGYLYTFSL